MSVEKNKPAKYARVIEIFPAKDALQGDKFNFPLDNELNNRQIECIEVFASDVVEISPAGREVPPAAALGTCSISLFQDEDLRYNDIPLRTLRVLDNNGNKTYLKDFRINLQNSFVKTNASGVIDSGMSFVFVFWYNK